MDTAARKRNVSDGDSGFESALSSRSSSISLEESHDLGKLLDDQVPEIESEKQRVIREKFAHILSPEEDIFQDVTEPELFIIRDKITGREILYKPPNKIKFSSLAPQIAETYSAAEYTRSNPISRSQLFNARLELELEKQVAALQLVEINLRMDPAQVPPPSLGIRIIGVNMIHGVADKLNIYVKRVLEGSVAGVDGRIRVNDHIVEVNGISLVGVSQKLAAETLSSCAINPETGVVQFVVARKPENVEETAAGVANCPGVLPPPQLPPSLLSKISANLNQDADRRVAFQSFSGRRQQEQQQLVAAALVTLSAMALVVVSTLKTTTTAT